MQDTIVSPLIEDARAAVALAQKAGADAADARFEVNASSELSVRLGVLEDVGRSEDRGLSLRVFVGQRSARVSTTRTDAATLATLAERAVAMAKLAPEDPFSGLAPAELLATGTLPDLDLADAGTLEPDDMKALALECEAAARGVPGVTNSEGAGVSASQSWRALATSHGFSGGWRTTGYSLSAGVIAGEGAEMQRDYAHHGVRHFADLDTAAAIGRLAGERAVARLRPRSVASGSRPIVFEPRVGSSLIGHLIAAMSGPLITRRASFLLDREGEQLFAPEIAISADPLLPRGVRSRPVDAEGLAARAVALVSEGQLGAWLLDCASARQLGRAPTGHAGSGGGIAAGNVVLHPGTLTRDALIADISDGIYVTELVGQGVNLMTGDYSRAAAGFAIVNGEIAHPVSGFTIASSLPAMFAAMRVADDLDTHLTTQVPSIRIDGMTIAGD